MTFQTLEDIQDKAKMKATLKGLRRLKRPAPFLFKARCDAIGGDPLLLVSAPGKRLKATLIKQVRVGTQSIRGTVCREDSRLVFSTISNVNKQQMAKLISRIGTLNGANLPLKRIEIRTPRDAREAKQAEGAPVEAPRAARKAPEAAAPAPAPAPEKKKAARPAPRERVRRLRERAPVAPPEASEAPALDTAALEADLAAWRAQLASRESAQARAQGEVEAAVRQLDQLGAAVKVLAQETDLAAIAAKLRALEQLDDDPELPALAARAEKAREAEPIQELIAEWFEDVSEEHGWEIESLREAAAERAQAVEELRQLIASVELVLAQG